MFVLHSVSKDVIELIGIVEESFPNATFRVKVLSSQAKDHELHCTLAGRMRKFRVRILPGDRVKVEITPYDLDKGRITYRFRSDQILPLDEETEEKEEAEETEESKTEQAS
ncbi:TPA: translation initiation factor IF-1 [Candidatus Peribacteria bacterium]|nr:translation initiation factor IF-1 [Candidatus Peribacteria bacterium]